ncbi:MAG: molybdopterin-guanine dinucleotide biosynthesis protein B [Candidatus Bathyarchaeia archaeon]
MTKFVAVVGGKHSGKTTVIQRLIYELKRRGYRVGSAKEMSSAGWINLPDKDAWKHASAGAEIVIATPLNETVCFIKKRLNLNEMSTFFHGLDYVILEGFESEKTIPKIIAAKDAEEAVTYSDGLEIAISGIITGLGVEVEKASSLKIPIINCETEAEKLVNLVERMAFPKLPGMSHCGECGYISCYEFARALVTGKEVLKNCPLLTMDEVVLNVNGNRIPLKEFPRMIIKNTVLGMISSLSGVRNVNKVEIVVKRER